MDRQLTPLSKAVLGAADAISNPSNADSSHVEAAMAQLRECCLNAGPSKPGPEHAEDAWNHACTLWNAAVDASNRGVCSNKAAAVQVAWLRHVACELLCAVAPEFLQEFQQLQLIHFCLKASDAWCCLDMWEQSDVVLSFAAKATASFCTPNLQQHINSGTASHLTAANAEQLCSLLFDVHLGRLKTALKLDHQVLAAQSLSQARTAAEDLAPSAAISICLCLQLATTLQAHVAGAMLRKAEAAQEDQAAAQALADLASTAFELIGKVKAHQAAGSSTVQQVLQLESKVLLALAFCHLNFRDDPPACLRCVDALRQLDLPEVWSDPAVAVMALQAFMADGNLQQAEVEAADVAVHDKADVNTCIALVLELLKGPSITSPAALKTVLDLVLGRFPTEPQLLTLIIEHTLAAATRDPRNPATNSHQATGTTTADPTAAAAAKHGAFEEEMEALVLQLLEANETARAAVKANAEMQTKVHAVLYNHGVSKFEAKAFQAAVSFFEASLEFAEDTGKALVARVLVTCHLVLQHHDQALNYCHVAESYQPGSVATSFLRYKLLLLQGNDDGVMNELSHMVTCSDFNAIMLYLACQEAVAANATAVARAALLKLLAILQQQQTEDGSSGNAADGGGSSSGVSEGWVLRILVKLDSMEFDKQAQLFTELSKAAEATNSAAAPAGTAAAENAEDSSKATGAALALQEQQMASHADGSTVATAAALAAATAAAAKYALQLGELLSVASARVRALGLEAFAGEKETEGVKLLEWFSSMAWNAAIKLGDFKDYQSAAVLMHACAQLLSQLPHVGPKQLKTQKMAYLLAAAAAFEVHVNMPEHTASIKLAKKMCAAVKNVSQKLGVQSGGRSGDGDGLSEAFLLQLQFRVALQQQNVADEVSLMKQMSDHPAVSADMMHKLAVEAQQHPHRSSEVVAAALEGLLRKLMASSSPEWSKVAEVLRRLLQHAGSDADKLRLYREAAGIVSMLPRGSYPDRELSWLVSTAWNTGFHHARFDRHSEALQYMDVALSLLPCCPASTGLTSKRDMMTKARASSQAAVNFPAV